MTTIRSLERMLTDNLSWNQARIKFGARFLQKFKLRSAQRAKFVINWLCLALSIVSAPIACNFGDFVSMPSLALTQVIK
jgi:hypothetical protein